MKKIVFSIVMLLIFGAGILSNAHASISPAERQALIDLYESTDGDNWTDNSGWKEPPLDTDGFALPGTEGSWDGIVLGGNPGSEYVERIFLYSNQLTGNIPPELGNLTSLTDLNLSSNQLTGNIPPKLGNLTRLTDLSLSLNQLTGNIPPELGNLISLTDLNLSLNQLTGNIPPELGSLTSIAYLSLSLNQLTGNIPPELGNLSSLIRLNLGGNQLTGNIPPELRNLINLSFCNISWNSLYTSDLALKEFLDKEDSGWESTQTITPTNLSAKTTTDKFIFLTWTPIFYTDDTGGYEIYYSTTSEGPYTLFETTADKTVNVATVTGLIPYTDYYFVIRAVTNSHTNNQNTVYSEYTSEISASTFTPGDVDIDGIIDGIDENLTLEMLAGIDTTESINADADVNADAKIGIEEAIYIKEVIEGIRSKRSPSVRAYELTMAFENKGNGVVDLTAQGVSAFEGVGAAFTVKYDTSAMSLNVQSSFFDTFKVNEILEGVMISAARAKSSESDNVLFTLNFTSIASPGDYSIEIIPSILSRLDAGYSTEGEDIDLLVSSDLPDETFSVLVPRTSSTLPSTIVNFNKNISGHVYNMETGSPVYSGFIVQAYDITTGECAGQTITNYDGSYTIMDLPAGNYRVQVNTDITDYIYYVPKYYNTYDLDTITSVEIVSDNVTGVDFYLEEFTPLKDADNIEIYVGEKNYVEDGQISGNVKDVNGNNIGGIRVSVNLEGGGWYESSETDVNGNYTISNLKPGMYRVEVYNTEETNYYVEEYYDDAKDYSSLTLVEVQEGQTTEHIDFSLEKGGMITGKIIGEDGKPIEQIGIDAYDFTTGKQVGFGYTQSEGTYSIKGLPAGSYKVKANEYGSSYWYDNTHMPQYYDNTWDETLATPVEVKELQTTEHIDFNLEKGGMITGKVVDEDGKGLYYNIWVTAYDYTSGNIVSSTGTNSDGTYTITGLVTGTYKVQARTYGYSNLCDQYSANKYISQYYDNIADVDSATQVSVKINETTSGINFSLKENPDREPPEPRIQVYHDSYSEYSLQPGQTDTYTFEVRSCLDKADTFDLVLMAPECWKVKILGENTVVIDSYDSITVEAEVTIPADAQTGEVEKVTLAAIARSDIDGEKIFWADTSDQPLDSLTMNVGEIKTIRLRADIPADKTLNTYEFTLSYDENMADILDIQPTKSSIARISTSGSTTATNPGTYTGDISAGPVFPPDNINSETPGQIIINGSDTDGIDGLATISFIDVTIKGKSAGSSVFSIKVDNYGASESDEFLLTPFNLLLNVLEAYEPDPDPEPIPESDTTHPLITILGENPLTIEAGQGDYTDSGASAEDNVDGDISEHIITDSNVNPDKPGTYIVSYSVSDSAGNSASAEREVFVTDTTPPVITLNGETSVSIEAETSFTDPGAIAVDNIDGEISDKIKSKGDVNIEEPGTYQITYTVTDEAGNLSEAVRTVNVIVTNKSPSIADAEFTIPENSSEGTVVGWMNASDPNDDLLYFSISDQSGAFSIANSGEVIVNNMEVLDYETSPIFTFSVMVEDPGGLSDSASVTVNLTDMRVKLKPVAGNHGSIYPANEVEINDREEFIFTFTPAPGYEIARVSVAGKVVERTILNKYMVSDIIEDSEIRVDFKPSVFSKQNLTILPDTMQMISLSSKPEKFEPENIFGDEIGDYNTESYRIGTYDPEKGSGDYLEYADDFKQVITGHALWFYAREGLEIEYKGAEISKDYDIELRLHLGWNMIACPNNAGYDWNDIQVLQYNDDETYIEVAPKPVDSVQNDLVDKKLWKHNSTTYVYYDAAGKYENEQYEADPDNPVLIPGKGYWVKAKKENIVLRFKKSAQKTLSDSEIQTALLMRKGGTLIQEGKKIFSPVQAFAYSDDSPPEPIGGFSAGSRVDSGGCFILDISQR